MADCRPVPCKERPKECAITGARYLYLSRALRTFCYGLGIVVLGFEFKAEHLSSVEVGIVLTSFQGGSLIVLLLVGRYGNAWGMLKSYRLLWIVFALVGIPMAILHSWWSIALLGLSGVLSPETTESGPFTSLEQPLLAEAIKGSSKVRGFGTINAVAAASGALGAFFAGIALSRVFHDTPSKVNLLFIIYVPAGIIAIGLVNKLSAMQSSGDEVDPTYEPPVQRLGQSKKIVKRLSALYSVDSMSGGMIAQVFLSYWLARRYGADPAEVGLIFFLVGVFQVASYVAASRAAERFGLLNTIVFTHLPSNFILMALPLSPNLAWAAVILILRSSLSQMDVPTRQAYLMMIVTKQERTAAASYTSSARYLGRPFGPLITGLLAESFLSLPLVAAGAIKVTYDLALWKVFKGTPMVSE